MSENVKVAVRVRPFNQREKNMNAKLCIEMDRGTQQTILHPQEPGGKEHKFTFDFSYNSFVPRDDPDYASQTTVWEDLGVGVLQNAFDGYNCSLFAYGQTGSGKSYSMMGYGEDKGIIPIACQKIFERMADDEDEDTTMKLECSMLEIYMEKVRDLFNPSAGDNLAVREDKKIGFYVKDLTKNAVANYEQVEKLMEAGSAARTVASTNMNATSSRAHTIFQIILTQTRVNRETMKATDRVAVINLIDLAGSERAASTGATGDRLKEGSAINLSLSSLGNCISALAANSDPAKAKKKRVPYRDSVLTKLLKNSLGGNAKTIMIAAISPADVNHDETLSTLRYADRAKQIKNKAVVNEDPNEKLIRSLKAEIEKLRAALGGDGPPPDMEGMLEKEREEMRKKLEQEKEAEIQRMRAELQAKIKAELGGDYQSQIQQTEALQRQREEELRKMGVAVGADREKQLARAKEEPHIVNVHEDPMMSGQVFHFFPLDTPIKVGRKDAPEPQDVAISGIGIEKEHCVITNSGGVITLSVVGTAKTHVNGEPTTGERQLHHRDRLILGNNHVFTVGVPGEVQSGEYKADENVPETIDYGFCMMEMNRAQMEAMAAQEAKLREEAEKERKRAEEMVREMEEKYKREAEERAKYLEAKEKELQEQAARLGSGGGQEQEELLKAAQEKFKKEQEEMLRKQAELEAKLKKQMEETKALAANKEREMRQRSLLDEKLLKTIPLVNEANAISEELGKGMSFTVKLMANHLASSPPLKRAKGSQDEDDDDYEDDEIDEREVLDTEVYTRIDFADGAPPAMWHYDKFMNRLYIMREMYQMFVENDRNPAIINENFPEDRDPFFDPPEDQLIGKATIFLSGLTYFLSVEETTPIIDYKGKDEGELKVRIIPHMGEEPPADGDEENDEDFVENLEDIIGKKMGVTVFIDSARGLPATLNTETYVQFRFFLESKPFQTPVHETRTINPAFNFKKTFRPVVTQDFIDYLQKDALEFEVYGRTSGKKAAPAVPIAGSGSGGGGGGGGAPRSSVSDQEVAKYKAELAKEKEERDRLAAELEKATKQRSAMESTVKELETKVKNAREEALKALESSGGGDEAAQKAARAEFEMKAAKEELEASRREADSLKEQLKELEEAKKAASEVESLRRKIKEMEAGTPRSSDEMQKRIAELEKAKAAAEAEAKRRGEEAEAARREAEEARKKSKSCVLF